MNDYSTVDSDIDFGKDVEELMLKNDKLTIENETLKKLMREKEHESSQKIGELNMENEKLGGTNKGLEELLKTYQENLKIDYKAETAELQEQIANLENNLFLTEQSESNLKRQIQNLNMENSNLKLEINKLTINSKKEASLIPSNQCGDNFDNLDQETKNLIAELMNEIDDLKNEKNEISEKALNLLTEKELEVMEIKEQLDEIKNESSIETRKLLDQIRELQYENENKLNSQDDDTQSINSEEAKLVLEKYNELQYEFEEYKRIAEEKEISQNYKIENLQKEIEFLESSYKQNINDLESEINMLHSREDKNLLENESRANLDNQMLIGEIEHMQTHIRNLEEIKEKNELRNKEQIAQLNTQLKSLDITCYELKTQKTHIENELKDLEAKSNKFAKEIQEKHRIEMSSKNKELSQAVEKLERLIKDNEALTKEHEIIKKNSEKKKVEVIDLNEKLKKYKETNDIDRKKLEEKYFILEKKFECEKVVFLEQIKELNSTINNLKSKHSKRESEISVQLTTLSKMLAVDEKEDINLVDDLKQDINKLNYEIAGLNARILLYEKQKVDNELIIKENQKLKVDNKELIDMYEVNIKQLQAKAIEISNQRQSSRRRTSRPSLIGEADLSGDHLDMVVEMQNTINRLNGEQRFSFQKIELLTKEIESLKTLRQNDINYMKLELRAAEEQAINAKVSLATLAFEKDCEMMKYKKLCNRLKAKITGTPLVSPLKKK